MPIWKDAMEIALEIFNLSEHFPKKEDYGITSQLRRSALSISANIAEAFGRNHMMDKINFYYFARGSDLETQSHIEYSKRVGYLENNVAKLLDEKLDKLNNDLNKIIVSLKPQPKKTG